VIGAKGGICALANIAASQLVSIRNMHDSGNFKEALQLQQLMVAPNRAVTTKYGVPGLKAAMDAIGYHGGDPRLPLLPLTATERSDLETILREGKLIE
jgi:4-hydroxy-2-oxoglutarate aldolase